MSIKREIEALDEACDFLNGTVITIPQLTLEADSIFNEFGYITEGKILDGFKSFIEKVKEWFKKIARKIRLFFENLKIVFRVGKLILKDPIGSIYSIALNSSIGNEKSKINQAIEYVIKNNIDTEIEVVDFENDYFKKIDDNSNSTIFRDAARSINSTVTFKGLFDKEILVIGSDSAYRIEALFPGFDTANKLVEEALDISNIKPDVSTKKFKLYEYAKNKEKIDNAVSSFGNMVIDLANTEKEADYNMKEVEWFLNKIVKEKDIDENTIMATKTALNAYKGLLMAIANQLNNVTITFNALKRSIVIFVNACLKEYKKANK